MCGIHGFAWKDNGTQMAGMLSATAHRGPDGTGSWTNDKVTLGHNMLAITEHRDRATQPWTIAHKVLVFNGEVYNYRDLRNGLSHKFKTDCDTEVLAAGLHEQGLDFLRRVDGMFALAWYDPHLGHLTLARDTNGAKPLYAGFLDDRPCFSSEIRGLLSLGFDRVVNQEAFRHYYNSGMVSGPLTLFRGINRLVPGQVITFDLFNRDSTTFSLQKAPKPFPGKPHEIGELLRAKLRQAVKLTLGGRRKVGMFLSGGIDSAAVYYEAKALNADLDTYTSRFDVPHERCQHNNDADRAAALTGGDRHFESHVTQQLWVDGFADAVIAMEEPRQGRSHPAYLACNRLMSQNGVVVTLSGDGGDELLCGYKHHGPYPYRDRLLAIRPQRALNNPELKLTRYAQHAYFDRWLPVEGLSGDAINDFMYAECMTVLAEDFLMRNDKLGMSVGMEGRFPMLCTAFRDFARSIPGELKMGTGVWAVNNKILLREAYRRLLPDEIVTKPKTGWRAPTDEWIVGTASFPAPDDGPVRDFVRATLSDPVVRELFEITEDDVENRYLNNRDHGGPPKAMSGKPSIGPGLSAQKELFTVLSFAAWFKAFNMRLW
jgi:asparagine synthase (glutamine-hydrolysing)